MRKTKLELELKHGISLKLENAVVINFFFKNVSEQTNTRNRSGY